MTTVFSPRHNWAAPYVERWSYLTDVQEAEGGSEQRRALNIVPHRQDVLAPTTGRAWSSAALDALLLAGQVEDWAVPYWPGASTLTAAASAGSSVALALVTTDRGFANAGYAVLYRDDRTTELVGPLSSLSGSGFTVPTLAATWPVGTIVCPAVLAQWGDDATVTRRSTAVSQTAVTFDAVSLTDPAVATPSLTLFDVARFSRREAPAGAVIRRVDRITSPTSRFQDFARATTPERQHLTAPLWLKDRATASDLLTWFHGVKGRYGAFYLPTYAADFTVLSGLGTTTLVVEAQRYATRLFPLTIRRAVVAIGPDGTLTERTITNAVDNGDGTETLTLNSACPSDTIQLSFRLTVRLASDTLELRWLTSQAADARLEIVEVPA